MEADHLARLAYLALLLVAVAGWVLVEYRKRMGEAMRVAIAWGLIFGGVAAGYGLWNDMGGFAPPPQMVAQGGEITVPRAADGHYYLTLQINGTPIRFLADTGASNMVLSLKDARKLGIDPEALVYLGQASTANGPVATARVTLPSMQLGPYDDTDFSAWVNRGEMDGSLLGMDYLRLYRVEIAGDEMILRR
ncbi:retropepsin-like aspartic protease family protein [Paragemmobacter straminiformis]|uniref:TIGR02281 family clan AA aspartic protease n=1 Tax=Paragemmobacter straminiformis TaxID=2045119 RepID=A0A842I8S6_9RHOB|nr:TIGR02281 family clan AA aspartic protease [Gemmobacter straminiformis]MBC2835398.1 TIGR02281 family clan AA aspartic protease [Gemmobacter straminiformis]